VQVGYFAQGHADLDPEKTALETILDAREMAAGEARNLLGRYRFSGDDVFKHVGALSGGEQARVALAVLTLQGANVLILDEPTNHLDIPSQEVLQEALAEFGGTLLIVTHDRYLIRRLASRVWAIEGGQLWAFEEGYEAYQVWQERRRQQQRLQRATSPQRTERERERERQKAAQRAETRRLRRQTELEDTIHHLEAHKVRLEAQLAAASERQQVERVSELGTEYGRVEAELNELLAAWEDAVA
jgi:ATP-binding cassette subfamily F protein 3